MTPAQLRGHPGTVGCGEGQRRPPNPPFLSPLTLPPFSLSCPSPSPARCLRRWAASRWMRRGAAAAPQSPVPFPSHPSPILSFMPVPLTCTMPATLGGQPLDAERGSGGPPIPRSFPLSPFPHSLFHARPPHLHDACDAGRPAVGCGEGQRRPPNPPFLSPLTLPPFSLSCPSPSPARCLRHWAASRWMRRGAAAAPQSPVPFPSHPSPILSFMPVPLTCTMPATLGGQPLDAERGSGGPPIPRSFPLSPFPHSLFHARPPHLHDACDAGRPAVGCGEGQRRPPNPPFLSPLTLPPFSLSCPSPSPARCLRRWAASRWMRRGAAAAPQSPVPFPSHPSPILSFMPVPLTCTMPATLGGQPLDAEGGSGGPPIPRSFPLSPFPHSLFHARPPHLHDACDAGRPAVGCGEGQRRPPNPPFLSPLTLPPFSLSCPSPSPARCLRRWAASRWMRRGAAAAPQSPVPFPSHPSPILSFMPVPLTCTMPATLGGQPLDAERGSGGPPIPRSFPLSPFPHSLFHARPPHLHDACDAGRPAVGCGEGQRRPPNPPFLSPLTLPPFSLSCPSPSPARCLRRWAASRWMRRGAAAAPQSPVPFPSHPSPILSFMPVPLTCTMPATLGGQPLDAERGSGGPPIPRSFPLSPFPHSLFHARPPHLHDACDAGRPAVGCGEGQRRPPNPPFLSPLTLPPFSLSCPSPSPARCLRRWAASRWMRRGAAAAPQSPVPFPSHPSPILSFMPVPLTCTMPATLGGQPLDAERGSGGPPIPRSFPLSPFPHSLFHARPPHLHDACDAGRPAVGCGEGQRRPPNPPFLSPLTLPPFSLSCPSPSPARCLRRWAASRWMRRGAAAAPQSPVPFPSHPSPILSFMPVPLTCTMPATLGGQPLDAERGSGAPPIPRSFPLSPFPHSLFHARPPHLHDACDAGRPAVGCGEGQRRPPNPPFLSPLTLPPFSLSCPSPSPARCLRRWAASRWMRRGAAAAPQSPVPFPSHPSPILSFMPVPLTCTMPATLGGQPLDAERGSGGPPIPRSFPLSPFPHSLFHARPPHLHDACDAGRPAVGCGEGQRRPPNPPFLSPLTLPPFSLSCPSPSPARCLRRWAASRWMRRGAAAAPQSPVPFPSHPSPILSFMSVPLTCTMPATLGGQPLDAERGRMATDMITRSALHSTSATATSATSVGTATAAAAAACDSCAAAVAAGGGAAAALSDPLPDSEALADTRTAAVLSRPSCSDTAATSASAS
ncbi:unnamed protein product [Closterium sp. Naga37s-1]|nr:unnamed protein product [Closterium sp. Naga37s-1]